MKLIKRFLKAFLAVYLGSVVSSGLFSLYLFGPETNIATLFVLQLVYGLPWFIGSVLAVALMYK